MMHVAMHCTVQSIVISCEAILDVDRGSQHLLVFIFLPTKHIFGSLSIYLFLLYFSLRHV